MMAAVDQSMSQFDHDDLELRGRPGIWGSYPPLGKIGVDEAAEQFLTAVLGTESKEHRDRSQRFHKIETGRTRYCVVRLPERVQIGIMRRSFSSVLANCNQTCRFSFSAPKGRPRMKKAYI